MGEGRVEFTPPEVYRIMDEDGHVDENDMPNITDDHIKQMYEHLVYARQLDNMILKLQREGRCGTYASSLGEEATQVGSAMALEKNDWMFPYFREIGSHIVRGFPMHLYLLYWMGNEQGSKVPEDINDFVIAVPVGSQIPHTAGAAMAAKIRKDGNVVLGYMGDGATSEGDFHEGLNFAGAFKAPAVFVCQNNQWAISVPLKKQTASETIAQKAIGYGMDGLRVDGNDVFAVYKVVKEAVDKARKGGGPTFVECVTYRMSDHTTADDAKRYRPPEELGLWKAKDPIERLRKYMEARKLWTEDYEKSVIEKVSKKVDADVRNAESAPAPGPEEMFDYIYKEMPEELKEQKASLLNSGGGKK